MEIRFTDGSYTDGGERIMLDPTVYPDWQIGAAAERALPPDEGACSAIPFQLPHGANSAILSMRSLPSQG